MAEEKENGGTKRREITFSLGPLKMTLRGYDVLLSLLFAGVVGLGVYVFKTNETFATEHKDIVESNGRQEQAFAEMVYILQLDAEERKKLNLQMPESLKRKMRRD